MLIQKIKLFLALVVIASGLFLFQIWHANNKTVVEASDLSVVINEIAWMGSKTSAVNEWIELRNLTGNEIDLSGWTLKASDGQPAINLSGKILPNEYFLLERTNDDSVPGVTADIIYTGALGNSGEILELKDKDSNIIDSIDATNGWPGGDNTTKATMERKDDGGWQTSSIIGSTPKAVNSNGETTQVAPVCGDGKIDDNEECDDSNNINNDGCSDDCRTESPDDNSDQDTNEQNNLDTDETSGSSVNTNNINKIYDILINEIVSDPSDNDVEWIELINTRSKTIDLANWTIEDGSGSKTVLSGTLGVNNNKFKVIEKPKGALNNKGDLVLLKDNNGKTIDRVAYGNWDDGSLADNAPVAVDPYSLARLTDGYNSGNNGNDFSITQNVTKGKINIIDDPEAEAEISEEEKKLFDFSSDIIISEIYPNPVGVDSQNEFIEIFNKGDREVDLLGWSLGDDTERKYEIAENKIIKAGEYLAFLRHDTKIALNNGADGVRLYQPLKDKALQTVKYKKAKEGWSYVNSHIGTSLQDMTNDYVWTEIVTPDKANEIKTVNHVPVVDFEYPEIVKAGISILFDSSDTNDEDDDKLIYSWDFGDKTTNSLPSPEHTYLKAGSYKVKLTVEDGTNKASAEKTVKVSAGDFVPVVLGWEEEITDDVVLNEILPNPVGSDETGEWIEIYNQGETKINLLNWRLEDGRGEKSAYKFKTDKWLDVDQYLVIKRTESKLALNNDTDFVRLFNDSKLASEVKYDKTYENFAFARNKNGQWQWTSNLTPGQSNIFAGSVNVKKTAKSSTAKTTKKSTASKKVINTTLEKIGELSVGDLVIIEGTVAVLPGVFGTQYFYIVGSSGVQIYNYKKDFPGLKVGDYIEVNGEISEINGEKRVKTKTKADIKILENRLPPKALAETCEKLDSSLSGQLITLTGEVADRKGSTVYFDDGTEEAILYIKQGTGISITSIKSGDKMSATGIVGLTKTGARLMPRSPEDMVRMDKADVNENSEVLGEVSKTDEWNIEQRDKKVEMFKYFLVFAAGIIIILVFLLIKNFNAHKKASK